MDWKSCIDMPASIPGKIADFSFTLVFGMNTYSEVNAMESSMYGDSLMDRDIIGPSTMMSFN